jgi:hypothetical protein
MVKSKLRSATGELKAKIVELQIEKKAQGTIFSFLPFLSRWESL